MRSSARRAPPDGWEGGCRTGKGLSTAAAAWGRWWRAWRLAGEPRTLEEVGRAFGVTRERIRQIENNTLKKLESLPEAQGLREISSETVRA